ncbi:N-6 DNA methylase [Sorangium sp. So ce1036]|uniref:restriction endonuclease subunit M n=1 Tax=Sorangium sp. So ce1036 TaxID=3133328 RepID=UPI003F0218F5
MPSKTSQATEKSVAPARRRARERIQEEPIEPEPQNADEADDASEDVVPQGQIVCALTGELFNDTPEEQTLQSFIDQLEREYGVDPKDMARDVTVEVVLEEGDKEKRKRRKVSLAVYDQGKPHTIENLIRVVLIAKAGTKPDRKALDALEDVLSAIPGTRARVFGLWTNGELMEFRLRTFDKKFGHAQFTELTDFPAPDESLEDLEKAERRPLRIATKDSLVRTFKRCHDYLYGNRSMDSKKAFWQLLQLIFCKIYDEQQSAKLFFVGATEANSDAGLKRVHERIDTLFAKTKAAFDDVLESTDRLELTDRALAFIVGQLGRYNFLGTDADAKGLAYESITSTTLKRERGQFFTPRNVIQMMVRMIDPKPGERVLDPACGSGGFLVVALNHVRRELLAANTDYPDHPVPSELKRIEKKLRDYATKCLFGIDVDADLRKAARMNMVMNNDGHGNIFSFNSLEFWAKGTEESADRERFKKSVKAFEGQFDIVFTNPPFGSKIPVDDPKVLEMYELGHQWRRQDGQWVKGAVQKKVPPEILFIEACCNFLKPGTGRMALVLPDGILGNPGEQMEGVRAWMLREMELLASVDLPAEAFLPQVSVQASCVFLRRRHDDEKRFTGGKGPNQRPVFMAIAEKVGHGRRGEKVYLRKPDGEEKFEPTTIIRRWERDGEMRTDKLTRLEKILADDLPWIAAQYLAAAHQAAIGGG